MTDEEKADCGLLSELFPEDDAMTPPSEELKVALPEPGVMCDCGGDYYTADQMQAAIQAERERCAKLCREKYLSLEWSDAGLDTVSFADALAAAIREGKQ